MNKEKIKVLFVCIHNSARSQMAEAYLNHFGSGDFAAQSAGLEPGTLNPLVVRAMREDGLDIAHHKPKSVHDILRQHKAYDYVITVCDEASAEQCPRFPGSAQRLHWGFPDPSGLCGSDDKKLNETHQIRAAIKQQVLGWIKEFKTQQH